MQTWLQVEEVLAFARIKPVVNQIELHPLLAQRKLVGVCLRKVRTAERWIVLMMQGKAVLMQRRRVGAGLRKACRCCVWIRLAEPLLNPGWTAWLASCSAWARAHRRCCRPVLPVSRAALPPNARLQGVYCVAYSPLGVGKDALLQHPAVLEVAAETGKSPAQVGRHVSPCIEAGCESTAAGPPCLLSAPMPAQLPSGCTIDSCKFCSSGTCSVACQCLPRPQQPHPCKAHSAAACHFLPRRCCSSGTCSAACPSSRRPAASRTWLRTLKACLPGA